jgi:uncharacterized protein YigE (DUF2233 family)
MRRFAWALVLTLGACSATPADPAPAPSSCESQQFERSRFIVCRPAAGDRLSLVAAGANEAPRRHFRDLGVAARTVDFAMNAGMFGEDGRPIGLAVVDGQTIHKINLRAGGGNFGLKPNGVFLVHDDGQAEVVVSEDYARERDVSLATQSGPMLVVDGQIHPKFSADGESRNMRNGVGVAPDGAALFVMTGDPVSLGKMARFFRDRLQVRDALYFDGSVSSLWDPANGRMDDFTELGPIIVATKSDGR